MYSCSFLLSLQPLQWDNYKICIWACSKVDKVYFCPVKDKKMDFFTMSVTLICLLLAPSPIRAKKLQQLFGTLCAACGGARAETICKQLIGILPYSKDYRSLSLLPICCHLVHKITLTHILLQVSVLQFSGR